MDLKSLECCGVKEVDGVSDYADSKEIMLAFCGLWFDESGDVEEVKSAFALFTDETDEDSMQDLARYIKRNKLGSTLLTDSRQNLNTGNDIMCLLYGVDYRNLEKWYSKK